MAGKLGVNLRSGHLSEDVGVLFFRHFCAVAQVRQEDDYGIDIISTLLKKESGLYYAEKSFYVQIKSALKNLISFDNQDLHWLRNLDLPYFIATVDRQTQDVKMYTINPVFDTIINPSIEKLSINLDESVDFFLPKPIAPNHVEYSLKPPIWEAQLQDFNDPEFYDRIYKLTSKWVDLEFRLMQLRKFRRNESHVWETWEAPSHSGTWSVGSKGILVGYLKSMKPFVEMLYQDLIWSKEPDGKFLTIYLILDWFEEFGIQTCIDKESLKERIAWPTKDD